MRAFRVAASASPSARCGLGEDGGIGEDGVPVDKPCSTTPAARPAAKMVRDRRGRFMVHTVAVVLDWIARSGWQCK